MAESAETLAGKLTVQMDSLQEAFLPLSRAGTLQDLAGGFSVLLERFFPRMAIDLYHQASGDGLWSHVAGRGAQYPGSLLPVPLNGATSASALNDGGPGVTIVQRLIDRSHLCLLLRGEAASPLCGDGEVVSLRLSFQLFDSAYQSLLHRRRENVLLSSLNQRVLQLASLIDTGTELAKPDRGSSVCRLALERAVSLTSAGCGKLTIMSSEQILDVIMVPPGASHETQGDERQRLSSVFVSNGKQYTFELFDKESQSGTEAFEETDRLLLDTLVGQVRASLENDYLHREALEKEKIEHDLSLAASIQQQILPKSLPSIEGYDIAGVNIPTKLVGGDYYNCVPLPGGRYALVIADVTGKGMSAALLVSSLHAYLSAYLESPTSPVQLVRRLNKVIFRATTDDRFITAFIAFFDPRTGTIESVSAGHNPAYLRARNGDVRELSAGGLPLGMLDVEFPLQSETVMIGRGDRLLLYTDGVTEAPNEQRTLYDSVVPLKTFLAGNTPERAEQFIQDLIGDIRKFTGNAAQNDDITALYLLRH
jgi:serine phosphatase RsbU (regulator of sigma subunit)